MWVVPYLVVQPGSSSSNIASASRCAAASSELDMSAESIERAVGDASPRESRTHAKEPSRACRVCHQPAAPCEPEKVRGGRRGRRTSAEGRVGWHGGRANGVCRWWSVYLSLLHCSTSAQPLAALMLTSQAGGGGGGCARWQETSCACVGWS